MAKGYSGYINYQWKRLQKELLLDACFKLNCKDPSEDIDFFEEVIFKDVSSLNRLTLKSPLMDNSLRSNYVKRTQKDYSLSFKLEVVREVESGKLSLSGAKKKYGIQGNRAVVNWIGKYGNLDRELQVKFTMKKSPEQRLLELEAKNRLLEKQKASLEQQLKFQQDKAIMFDIMVDIAEKEFSIPIRIMSARRLMPRIGTHKLYHLLGAELPIGRDQLFRILRANQMLIYPKKCYYITTNSKHWLKKHKNIVNDLDINRPEQVWVSDITYLGIRKNQLYLSLVSDVYS